MMKNTRKHFVLDQGPFCYFFFWFIRTDHLLCMTNAFSQLLNIINKWLFISQVFIIFLPRTKGFPGGTSSKEPICQCWRHKKCGFDPWIRKIPLEEGMAAHSSILAWRIPQTEEPGGLQSIRSQRVGHD